MITTLSIIVLLFGSLCLGMACDYDYDCKVDYDDLQFFLESYNGNLRKYAYFAKWWHRSRNQECWSAKVLTEQWIITSKFLTYDPNITQIDNLLLKHGYMRIKDCNEQ